MTSTPPHRRIRFDGFEVDRTAEELRRGGAIVRIQVQPLQILLALLESPGEIVTRETLRERLWPSDTFVDFDQSLNTAVRKLRHALGDSADAPRYVETLAKRGYRFIAPIETPSECGNAVAALEVSPETKAATPLPHSQRLRYAVGLAAAVALLMALVPIRFLPQPERRQHRIDALVVLPFANLTGQPQQEYLADALTDSIINDLSAAPTLKVISRTSAMRYARTRLPLPEIARQLRVDAVVEGSVAVVGDRLHVNARLVDPRTDASIWAAQYDRGVREIAAVQSEIASAIAGRLQMRISGRHRRFVACDQDSYLLYLNGRHEIERDRKPPAAGSAPRHATDGNSRGLRRVCAKTLGSREDRGAEMADRHPEA